MLSTPVGKQQVMKAEKMPSQHNLVGPNKKQLSLVAQGLMMEAPSPVKAPPEKVPIKEVHIEQKTKIKMTRSQLDALLEKRKEAKSQINIDMSALPKIKKN